MLLNLYFHHQSAVLPALTSGLRIRYALPIKPWKRRPRDEDEALLLAVLR